MLGRGHPVGVDGGDVIGIGVAAPATHEPLGDGRRAVDVLLGHHRQAEAARRLGHERQRHHRRPGQVVADLVVVDVEQLPESPERRQHRQRTLHVDADVAGVDRDGERLGGRQTGVERAVDQETPHVPVVVVTDELFDVDAAVAQRATLAIRLGDLRLERDHALESVLNYYYWFTHSRTPCNDQVCLTSFSLSRTSWGPRIRTFILSSSCLARATSSALVALWPGPR